MLLCALSPFSMHQVVHTMEGRPSEYRALLLQEDELDEEYHPDLYPMSHYGQETDDDCV